MCELPKTVQGLIQGALTRAFVLASYAPHTLSFHYSHSGVLPPILLALLFILLPIILRRKWADFVRSVVL